VLVVLLGGAAGAFWKWGRPWLKARPPKPTGELQVHVLDVGPGEGDSILIVSPTGTSVLIDAGDAGKGKAVLAALKQYKIEKLDYFIASHPHPDHIGGADEVINQIKVGTVIDNGVDLSTPKPSPTPLKKGARPAPTPAPTRKSKVQSINAFFDEYRDAVDNQARNMRKPKRERSMTLVAER